MFISTMKKPSAFLPVAMSFTVLAVMLVHGATTGFVREEDEGTAAHIFQILMPAQIPIIALFAIKWLPRTSRQGLLVLALQAIAGLAVLAPICNFCTEVIFVQRLQTPLFVRTSLITVESDLTS